MCVVQGRRTSASLMVANLTDPRGEGSGKGGSRGLYSLFWQLRGDTCGVKTDFRCDLHPTQAVGLYAFVLLILMTIIMLMITMKESRHMHA